MELRLLGPFQAAQDGQPVTVGSRRQERCLLAILLLEPGHAVATSRLADLLWDGRPPASARGTIQTYVGRLRQSVGPYGLTIVTRHDGYAVDAGDHWLDTREFVELTRTASLSIDPFERVRLIDQAHHLWRGPLLADVADEPLRARLEVNLVDLRLSGCQQRAEALLTMGQHDQVLTELTPLVDQYPSREPLVALLMTALYRSNRPAEALARFEHTAQVLESELGVSPGPQLRRVRDQIVRRDRRLDRPPAPVFAVRIRDQWLPWATAGHPALELCNTYAGWGGPHRPGADWLTSYTTLAVWTEYVDLADEWTVTRLLRLARRRPVEAAGVLASARTLRTNLYACLTDRNNAAAFAAVARFAEAAAKVSVFDRDDAGLGRWRLSAAAGLALPVHAAARSAAQLLSDPRRHGVCACPGEACGWLFLDASGRRRFCSAYCQLANCSLPTGDPDARPDAADLAS